MRAKIILFFSIIPIHPLDPPIDPPRSLGHLALTVPDVFMTHILFPYLCTWSTKKSTPFSCLHLALDIAYQAPDQAGSVFTALARNALIINNDLNNLGSFVWSYCHQRGNYSLYQQFEAIKSSLQEEMDNNELMEAVEANDFVRTRCILKRRANPNRAADHIKSTEMLQLLLEYTIDVDINLLMKAIYKKNLPLVQVCLQQKIDLHKKTKHGLDVVSIACQVQCPDILRELLQHNPDKSSSLPLIICLKKSCLESFKLLLEYHWDVNGTDNSLGETALMVAVKLHKKNFIERLIQAGANKEIRNRAGMTALEIAQRHSFHELVPLLE